MKCYPPYVRTVLACLVACLTSPVGAQNTSLPHRALFEAVETYRAGNLAAALAVVTGGNAEAQAQVTRQVIRSHRLRMLAGGTAPARDELPWTIERLRAAGALHMEAALSIYKAGERNMPARVDGQIEVGELFFDEVGELEKRPSDAHRWELAIGQQALADGNFQVAWRVLVRACDRYPGQLLLLIACGSVYESFGTFRADASDALRGTAHRTSATVGQDPAIAILARVRAERSDHLRRARKAFEDARVIDAANTEAPLRLGHVLMRQGDTSGAARVLEALIQAQADQRTRYLARLLLGRVRERQKRTDEAAQLFREAAAVLPGQSARLALAHRLHKGGRAAEALKMAQAVTNPNDIDDPWWSYRFGQYWLHEEMLAALRAEARR